jgi:hypothetical protein
MNPPNTQNKDENKVSESIILDLETLSMQYRNLLVEYENAVNNYINYLQQEAATPCGSYVGTSTNISQTCINKVWQSVGCSGTAQNPPQNPPASLNDIINWAFQFSTNASYTKRMQCYGNAGNSYIILCVGNDGNLYSRQGLNAPWQKVNDNVGGNLKSICVGNDGKTIYGTTIINTIWTKPMWNSPTWNGLPNTQNCCVLSLAQGQDGTFVGVGTDNVLYSNTSNMFSGTWTQTASQGEQGINSVAIAPDGTLLVTAGTNIYKKNSYKNLPSQQWQGISNTCCVKSITIAPDGTLIGVGTDDQLYTKASYKDLSTPWSGPWSSENSSCCAISVAAVINPNYNASNYNQTSSPNFNINKQPLVSVPGSTYWGTTSIAINNSPTLQECKASCANTPNCTGATFNATAQGQPTCWLRGGDGNILGGLDTDYAIVTKGKKLLKNIQSINQRLTNINKQIQNKTNSGQPMYTEQTRLRHLKTSELISQFVNLTEERNKIDKLIGDYHTLDEKQTQGNLTINQNYYSFVLLLFLAIIFIIGLFYFGGSSAESQGISSILNTNFIVIIAFLFALLIACIVIVVNKTAIQVNNLLPTSWFPTSLPQLKLSKFGWN